MNAGKELSRLTSKILTGEMRYADVEEALNRIAMQYGEDCFNSFPVERKEKPWSEKDLEELGNLSACGAGSREFYLYMAEVSDYVYSKKADRRKKNIGVGIAAVAMIVIVLVVIFTYRRSDSACSTQSEDVKLLDNNEQGDYSMIQMR